MALKVLLADDSVPAQNMGKKILADAGYEVLAVSNGLEALKKIADSVPDIAILDIFMPGYTGLEVCSRLRGNAVTAELPVILTVGKLEPYRPEDGEKVHSNAVIVKPFASEELVSAVRSLVGLPFAIRSEAAAAKASAPPPPASDPVPEDDYEEEAPMLAGIGFDGVSSAPAGGLGFNPDLKRSAFSASAVDESPATPARTMPAFEATAGMDVPAVSPSFTDFEISPATASAPQADCGHAGEPEGSAATATALVDWWQPTPEAVELADAGDLEFGGKVAAALPEIPQAAATAAADEAEERKVAPAAEASLPDRESRMQAFEELFNSDEALPVEANPAALPDLLAQEELEAAHEYAADTVSPIALEDEPDAGLPVAAAASAATENAEIADAAHELQFDADSISDWLTTGKIPHQTQPAPEPDSKELPPSQQAIALDADSELTEGPACNSFYAGIPQESETPKPSVQTEDLPQASQAEAADATPPMVCYLPKEDAAPPARESSGDASLPSGGAEFSFGQTAESATPESEAAPTEAQHVEMQELTESMTAQPAPEPAPESGEAVPSGLLQQMTSELSQDLEQHAQEIASGEASGDQTHEEPETVSAAGANGDAKRIHQAVESVFDRFRPLLIAAIAREITKGN